MGAKRNAILGIITIAAFVGCGLLASAEAQDADTLPEAFIDYDGFVGLSGELAAYRQTRLVDLETFNAMKAEPGTILLDTRSSEAFHMGHIEGAVNLNFSDFADDKLLQQQFYRQCCPGDGETHPAGPECADLHQSLRLWIREYL